ncbi:hypothetical protein ACFL29_02205 [Patescibacteria group bacterium]
MFATNLDLLYFVLAVSVGLLTIFLVWLLVYVISAVRSASKILKEIRRKYTMLEKAVMVIKERLEKSSSHLGLIAEAVKHIVMHFIEGKIEVKTKGKKK